MEYRRLGKTGLSISRLILGCGNFGGIGSAPAFYGMGENESEAHALLDRAWDAGITTFDTADAYGGGRSETYLGSWLHAKGPSARDQIVIESKVFNPVGPGPNQRGLSRLHILRQIDASLRRLRTDRLDLYLIHEPDPQTPMEETLRALDDIVRAGKALYVGASNIEAWRTARARGVSEMRHLARFEVVQNSYSLLERAAEREMLPYCAHEGVGFTAFSPLAGGWLTGKYRMNAPGYAQGSRMSLRPEPYLGFDQPHVYRGLSTLEAEAKTRGLSMSALATAWVLHHTAVTAAVIGPRSPAHLDQALGAIGLTLSDEEAEGLAESFVNSRAQPSAAT